VIKFSIKPFGLHGWLVGWLFPVLRPAQEFFIYMETAYLGLWSALRTFEQGGIFIVPHLLWHGTSVFSGLIRRTALFCRLLRCGESILTRIITGPGFMEFDHMTNWYLYPKRNIKMIPYFLKKVEWTESKCKTIFSTTVFGIFLCISCRENWKFLKT
jgi:hypothetical protein